MREVLFIALAVACPLMMMLMMRGGHGHAGGRHERHGQDGDISADELRRRRDELDRRIAEREEAERCRLEEERWAPR
jgi:DUF2933 family protein